jgi:hypothetical protein
MARKKKPPGLENWTWDEINLGRKMSKSEKRIRRLSVSLGATKKTDGQIEPPFFDENPTYYFVFIGLLVLCFVLLLTAGGKR